jgi:hypothetical protein
MDFDIWKRWEPRICTLAGASGHLDAATRREVLITVMG